MGNEYLKFFIVVDILDTSYLELALNGKFCIFGDFNIGGDLSVGGDFSIGGLFNTFAVSLSLGGFV